MKNNIPGYKDNMSVKVIKFITFDSTRIAKKNTFFFLLEKIWSWFEQWWRQNTGSQRLLDDYTQGAYEIRVQKVFYHVAREKEAY